MKERPRRVWFLASPGAEMLGVTGPWAVLGHANDALGRQAYAPQLVTVAGGSLRTGHGLELAGARSLRSATRLGLPDDVVVAGCPRALDGPAPEPGFVAWLRRHHARIPRLISICGGAFVLGEAGLLDGRRATTHWRLCSASCGGGFPETRVIDDEIYARDGRVWTSAGITAGIDLMLALVEEDHGHALAMQSVAKILVLFLRRSGRQAQFSEALKRQESEPPRLRDLSAIVAEHLLVRGAARRRAAREAHGDERADAHAVVPRRAARVAGRAGAPRPASRRGAAPPRRDRLAAQGRERAHRPRRREHSVAGSSRATSGISPAEYRRSPLRGA